MSELLGHCALCYAPVYDDESYVHTYDGALLCVCCHDEMLLSNIPLIADTKLMAAFNRLRTEHKMLAALSDTEALAEIFNQAELSMLE